jgi:chitosanase
MKNFLIALILVFGVAVHSSGANRFSDATTEQKVDQVVSIFENSTPELQYSYVEALPDNRGYTAGRAGFTSGTGDMLLVVERYQQKTPIHPDWPQLELLIPRLKVLADTGSGSLVGLETLPTLWEAVSDDSKFRDAQDEITEELYKGPARSKCQLLGIKTALGFLVIYDSIIQHGDGNSYDSLGGLLERTGPMTDEKTFITFFLGVRRDDLMNPQNADTAEEWRKSVDRVDALKRLVDANNWDLASPLRLEVWGKTFAL